MPASPSQAPVRSYISRGHSCALPRVSDAHARPIAWHARARESQGARAGTRAGRRRWQTRASGQPVTVWSSYSGGPVLRLLGRATICGFKFVLYPG